MDGRHRARKPWLKLEIVERVAAGERLKAVCAGEGMPSEAAVLRWRREDPAFDAQVRGALARARARRDDYDPAVGRALLDRLSAGERLADVLRDPAMPSRRRLRLWMIQDIDFNAAVWAMKDGRAAWRDQRLRIARARPFDPEAAGRVAAGLARAGNLRALLNGDPTLPGAATVQRWRRERPEFDAVVRGLLRGWARKRARERLYSEEMKEAVLSRIVMGGSFNTIGREPGMPCRRTLAQWMRAHADFAQDVAIACEQREDWYADRVFEIGMAAAPGAARAMGPLKRQLVRLRNRPGRKLRKDRGG